MKKRTGLHPTCLSLLLAAAVFLAGCGAGNTEETSSSAPVETNPLSIDWSSYHMAEPQRADSGSVWYLTEYHDHWSELYETDYDKKYSVWAGATGGGICVGRQYCQGNAEDGDTHIANYMDYFDTEAGQSSHMELDLAESGLPKDARPIDMDMTDDKLAVFLFRNNSEDGMPIRYCSLLFYHMEDGLQRTLDLLPALTAAGRENEPAEWSPTNGQALLCDRDGFNYLIWNNALLVVSETGELLCSMEQEPDAVLLFLCKMPDGRPLFVSRNASNRTNTYWAYDPAAGEIRSLGQSNYIEMNCGCMDASGNLYYLSANRKIVRWNTLSGEQENLFDCAANNICSNTFNRKVLTLRENGDLALMDPVTAGNNIYVLSPTPPAKTRTLSLVSTCHGAELEQSAAALFSMKNPEVNVTFSSFESSGSDDQDAYTTNLVNRIVAGDAPDMFVVSAETMYTLYEKGALADLTDIVSEDTREQVFDCIWNAGTIDGKLTGLTTDVIAYGILVSDDVWAQDTWSLEDILELAENAPAGTLNGLLPRASNYDTPSDILYWLALRDINSCLVDRESGTCHFDSDVFRKLLEYCKNTPVLDTTPENEYSVAAQAVRDGEYLAYNHAFYFGFSEFCTQMALFPDNYHWVGVPTDTDTGNQVYARDFLVVSKDTENMDLIREFLPLLYGDDLTRLYPESCLRRDVLRERVLDADEYNPRAQFYMGEGIYRQLECKPDGTAYTEEYIAFMDSCVLRPPMDSAIASIVIEEVEPYFSGDKDMDSVIKIIQSRVQLYLNETGS